MGNQVLQMLLSNAWSAALIIIFFFGSIFVHELGHFLAAKWRGLVIERFSLGFGPKIFSFTRGGVEYRLSWLPLGGYVALPQLADMRAVEGDTESKGLPPISYADKMIVSAAGAVFNVIFALILATILWQVGVPKPASQTTTVIGTVAETLEIGPKDSVPGPAYVAGLRPGDKVLRIDGLAVSDWMDLQQTLAAGTLRDQEGNPKALFTVERAGNELTLEVFPRVAGPDQFRMVGVEPEEPLVVASLTPGAPAERAGMLPGDRIRSVDGQPVRTLRQLQIHLLEHRARAVSVEVLRAGTPLTLPIQPQVEIDEATKREVARIGIALSPFLTVKHNPIRQLTDHVKILGRIIFGLLNPNSDLGFRHMSGPIGIAHGIYNLSQVSILLVLWFTVLINVNLAVLNVLPFPVLDGGHMLFATIGRLRGRELPRELVETVQAVFVVVLISVFVYVSFFDTKRAVRGLGDDAPQPAPAATPAPEAAKPATP